MTRAHELVSVYPCCVAMSYILKSTLVSKMHHQNTSMNTPKLYKEVLAYLDEKDYLKNIELPFRTGAKRYLISTDKIHPTGNEFTNPVKHNGFYMEAHVNKENGIRYLMRLCEECKTSVDVKLNPEPNV